MNKFHTGPQWRPCPDTIWIEDGARFRALYRSAELMRVIARYDEKGDDVVLAGYGVGEIEVVVAVGHPFWIDVECEGTVYWRTPELDQTAAPFFGTKFVQQTEREVLTAERAAVLMLQREIEQMRDERTKLKEQVNEALRGVNDKKKSGARPKGSANKLEKSRDVSEPGVSTSEAIDRRKPDGEGDRSDTEDLRKEADPD